MTTVKPASVAKPPPQAAGVPLLGAIPALLLRRLDHLHRLRERHGDIFEIDLGVMRIVALTHPAHAQHVLRDRARSYGKGNAFWDMIRGLLGNGLPVSEGEFWMRQRRMIQPHFHREKLAALSGLMVDAIDESLAEWDRFADEATPVDLFREMTRVTMRVIVKTLFGSQIDPKTADLVGKEMGYALDYMLFGMMTARMPGWVPVPGRKRFEESTRTLDAVLADVLARHQRDPGKSGGELISMLIDSVDSETSQKMTTKELRDEAMAMFLAGYETTSAALGFAYHHMLGQPDILQRLTAEVDARLGDRRPVFTDVRELPYALAIVQEALRLNPPVYWIPRTALEDDEIDGHQIKKGQEVGVITHVIQRHPELWPDPERFDPDRFTPDKVAARHPLAWIPFGVGQRLCVGKDFALMEGQFILARIASRYRLVAASARKPGAHIGVTLRPEGGVWARLERRGLQRASPTQG